MTKGRLRKRSFTKKYADTSQKKGGDLHVLLQSHAASVDTLGTPRPQPSIHAKMRAKGIHGPAHGTKARKKYAKQKTIKGIAQQVMDAMGPAAVGSPHAVTITD